MKNAARDLIDTMFLAFVNDVGNVKLMSWCMGRVTGALDVAFLADYVTMEEKQFVRDALLIFFEN